MTFVCIHTGIIHFRALSCQYPKRAKYEEYRALYLKSLVEQLEAHIQLIRLQKEYDKESEKLLKYKLKKME